jgi:hypothetical protein
MKSISNYKVTELEDIMKKISNKNTLLYKFYRENIHPSLKSTKINSFREGSVEAKNEIFGMECRKNGSPHERSEGEFPNEPIIYDKTKKPKKSDIYNNILSILSG